MLNITKQNKVNYEFIDNIRFIAIIAIVAEHSYFWPTNLYFKPLHEQLIQIFSMQLPKFGTIIFFLLAGFLIGDKINTYQPFEYLKRRFDNTCKPWLFWVFIYLVLEYINSVVVYFRFGSADAFKQPLLYFSNEINYIAFETSFWFIINFIICIAVLMVFRKYLYSFKFGLILALFSLFYAVNIYFNWIPSRHTMAFLGFVFYLWLGVQMHKYYNGFLKWINEKSFILLAALVVFTFCLAYAESLYLMNFVPKVDPYNTLRFTNILYSLAAFLFFFKIGNISWVNKLNPRNTTFGIYLIHYIVIAQVLPLIFRPLEINYQAQSAIFLLGFQILRFVLAFTVTYLLTSLIRKSSRIKWMIGQ